MYSSKKESIYSESDTEFHLTIQDFTIDTDKVSFVFQGKEDLVGTYYFKNDDILSQINYGANVNVVGDLVIPSESTIPNYFDYKEYLERKGIFYQIKIKSIHITSNSKNPIYKLKNIIYKRIKSIDKTGYMMAFILGDKSYLDETQYSGYQDIGIAHLFALSGMHISLITGLLLKLFKKVPEGFFFFIISLILFIYGFIVGYPASILRCIIFLILSGFNKFFHFDIPNLKLLFLAFFGILFLNHNYLYDTGFLYSFFSVFGILYSEDFIKKNYSAIRLSIVAFLFTLPISLYSFYHVNFLSIIYNLFFIPFVSVIVYPFLLISFICPFIYPICDLTLNVLISLSSFLNGIHFGTIYLSFSMIECVLFYLFLLLFIHYQKKHFLIICLLIIFVDIIYPYFDSSSYVIFFDVGQGDSGLIITSYRKEVIMIDTGGIINSNYHVSDGVISYLYSEGIHDIDYLILTHGDYDHMGESFQYVDKVNIHNVIFNCGTYNELESSFIKELDEKKIPYNSCIKEINGDSTIFSFLQTTEFDNENDYSNVIYSEIDGYRFMFMGDASSLTEHEILNHYNLSSVDVLKVGHHGSKTSSSIEFIDIIHPKYSIISVGKNNRYGHPNEETLENLSNSKIYRTDQDGTVIIKIKNSRLIIKGCIS